MQQQDDFVEFFFFKFMMVPPIMEGIQHSLHSVDKIDVCKVSLNGVGPSDDVHSIVVSKNKKMPHTVVAERIFSMSVFSKGFKGVWERSRKQRVKICTLK